MNLEKIFRIKSVLFYIFLFTISCSKKDKYYIEYVIDNSSSDTISINLFNNNFKLIEAINFTDDKKFIFYDRYSDFFTFNNVKSIVLYKKSIFECDSNYISNDTVYSFNYPNDFLLVYRYSNLDSIVQYRDNVAISSQKVFFDKYGRIKLVKDYNLNELRLTTEINYRKNSDYLPNHILMYDKTGGNTSTEIFEFKNNNRVNSMFIFDGDTVYRKHYWEKINNMNFSLVSLYSILNQTCD